MVLANGKTQKVECKDKHVIKGTKDASKDLTCAGSDLMAECEPKRKLCAPSCRLGWRKRDHSPFKDLKLIDGM